MLGYDSTFVNGETVFIEGQAFTVTGPHYGVTTWGSSIYYWEFTNQATFLYWDGGGDWTQYVHPGDVVLRYDSGQSRLWIYKNILRHYYYLGSLTSDTVQYIENLTAANSLPNSPNLKSNLTYQEIAKISSELNGTQPSEAARIQYR